VIPISLLHRVVGAAAWCIAIGVCMPASLAAQTAQTPHHVGGNEGKWPLGWQVRYDHAHGAARGGKAGADTVDFMQMTPGFHVTTGGAAIMWHPDSTARGDYVLSSEIFLFPTKGRDREGFGLLIGGSDLAGAAQRYTYFLLRNDGRFLVKQRRGEQLTTLVDWTALPEIKRQVGGDAMQNVLGVEVEGETVRFLVNGKQAAKLPRSQVNPDGQFGLRVNHGVNAHVVSLGRATGR